MPGDSISETVRTRKEVPPSTFMPPGYYPPQQFRSRGPPYPDPRSHAYRSSGMGYYPPPPYYYAPQLPSSSGSQAGNQISEDEYKQILERHRKRRICNETHPELDVMDINLADIITRANPAKKGTKNNNKKLKKIKKSDKKKKPKEVDNIAPPAKVVKQNPQEIRMKEEKRDAIELKPSKGKDAPKAQEIIQPTPAHGDTLPNCFFSLLRILFVEEQYAVSSLRQSSQQENVNPWVNMLGDWSSLVFPALRYLSGDGKASLLTDFVPLVNHNEQRNDWKWIGAGHDADSILLPLCQHWLDTLRQQLDEDKEPQDSQEPSSSRTEYVVRPSTEHEKLIFRHQERRRYENPHKPFVYTMHGFESTVGPVKGVYNKETGFSKAREHVLLVPNRPAYVTILCLVRDAVARLPNGEGTRAEVCQLLKDSQFINPQATEQQVHAVVSGALDRLHAEKDPCVKYDISRKVWIYLHKTRSYEEFERIHEASAAAAKAKKQLAQKQKSSKQKKAFQDLVDLHEQLASKNTTTASTSPNPPKKKKPKTSHQSSSPNTNKSPKVDISTEQGQVRASPKTATHSSPKTQVYASPKTPTHAPPKAPLLSPPDLQRQRPFTSPFHSYGLSKGVTESSPQAVAPLKITLPRGSIGSVSPSSLQLQQSVEQRPSIPGQNLSVKSGPLGSNQRIIVQQYPSIQSQAKDDSDSSSQ